MNGDWGTVHGALSNLFPDGTRSRRAGGYAALPLWPTAVFAAAAHLLERSGAYARIVPDSGQLVGGRDADNDAQVFGPQNLLLDENEVAGWKELGARWRGADAQLRQAAAARTSMAEARSILDAVVAEIDGYWQALVACCDDALLSESPGAPPQRWWKPTVALLIISDEACSGLGFHDAEDEAPMAQVLQDRGEDLHAPIEVGPNHFRRAKETVTYGGEVLNPYLARVMPKARTPLVGCTVRTLSHNVALTPPKGVVDIAWHRPASRLHDHGPLNILLIPFPFRIPAKAFFPLGKTTVRSSEPERRQWGWFGVNQTWLRQSAPAGQGDDASRTADAEQIAEFVADMVRQAARDVGPVHGVLLPELALDGVTFEAVVQKLLNTEFDSLDGQTSQVEFLVSGVAHPSPKLVADDDMPNEHGGNYVATTTFSPGRDNVRAAFTFIRAKHHRWQLNTAQISTYALGSALDSNVAWWEGMELSKRKIALTPFRQGGMFSSMICEDLARSEPCHEPLRAVGPSLVFVMLMDGPQLPHRWPSRYATVLADDPGSSVLTLTSLGLMERSNQAGFHKTCYAISLWKDDSLATHEIACPPGAQGVLLTISPQPARESTLDGRANDKTMAWRYRSHQPVALPPNLRAAHGWIVDR